MTPEPPTPIDPALPDASGRGEGSDASTPPAPRTPEPSAPPPGPSPATPDLDLFGHAPRGRADWSHRRGEPRVFALVWTLFLTVLATSTLMRAAVGGRLDLSTYRETLRMMLMVVATAIAVAWPMLRLSQARPRGGGVATTFKDLLIILVPLQAVLWPQAILAHWSIPVVAALDAVMGVWTILLGGIIALTLGPSTQATHGLPDAEISRPDTTNGRIGAMAIVVGLGAIGGAVAFVLDAALRPTRAGLDAGSWWMMLSPHTAINEITRDRAELGVSARVEHAHAITIMIQGAAGLVLWIAAALRERLTPRPHASPSHPDGAPPAPVSGAGPSTTPDANPAAKPAPGPAPILAPSSTPDHPVSHAHETAAPGPAELPGTPLAPDAPAR